VLANQAEHDNLAVGFATFFLNRTNRSGILNAGIIGGRDQTGPWKIDARYNPSELTHRLRAIASLKERISLTRLDALKFLKSGICRWPEKTIIYLDPPYYIKGRDLYYGFYKHNDHEKVSIFVRRNIISQKWIVSYDNVPPIHKLYSGRSHVVYDIGYTARSARRGDEVMFFCDGLEIPPLVGAINPLQARLLSA
jgi:DNA adenine methylase